MKYFSMFSGIGGFDLALNRQGHECIGYSEIDKYAIQTYQKNFGTDVKNYGDATKINTRKLPNFDLLCAGFPCQAFSIAGKRRGFKDTRGTLFFEIARVLEAKRPDYFLLENVRGLLSHAGGNTFEVILRTLEDLGYGVQWMVLNSKFFGVPQNRERVFIIGSPRGEPRPEILPFRKNANKIQKIPRQDLFTNTITARYEGAQGTGSYIIESELYEKIYDIYNNQFRKDGIAGTLKGQGISKTSLGTAIFDSYHKSLNLKNTGAIKPKVGSTNIVAQSKLRRLTPLECERLQGFPDNWTAGVSNTQRYKQIGNAVTVNVIEEILKNWVMP